MEDTVLREDREGIAILTLNRPDRLNAWIPPMGARYFDLLAEAGADPDVRAIVVTGAGRGFCAGADMEALQAIGTEEQAEGDPRPQSFPLTIPKPIIGAINGPVAGIGLVIALFCDVRFAAAGAKFTTAFARRGLIAEYGLSWLMPRLVGPARALDLLLSGRVIVAEEAERMGMVNEVCPPADLLDRTLGYARELATLSAPSSMATIKQQVWEDLESALGPALTRAERLMEASLTGDDFREGVASFVEGRPPAFTPL